MSATPRTDANTIAGTVILHNGQCTAQMVSSSFARQLETELAHLNDEVERLKKDNLDMGHWIGSKMYEPEWDSFKKSLEIIDHWKARVKKTEAALDVMTTELGKMFLSAAERADRNVELRFRAEKAEAEVERMKDYAFWKDTAKTRAENLERASEQMLAYEQTIARLRAENEDLAIRAGLRLSALDYEKLNTEAFEARAEKAEAALAAAVDGVIDGGNCREKMLYIHVPSDVRGHMMGQPVKVILPAIDAAMNEASK